MTKQEAFDFLLGKKVLCLNLSETIKVQKKLFEIGYMWSGEEQEPIIDYFAIFMREEELTMTTDINYWIEDECEKIEVSEILSIDIEIEKPKFNPKDLQPFDKVLVRDYKNVWRARFYDYCADGKYETTDGCHWMYCVPFNDETKHLHNTKIEEPEFYQI